jgi:hypothetical protein
MFVATFWRKQQLRKLSVMRALVLGHAPKFGITYKGPGWRHLNTKNGINVEKILQKDKTDKDDLENPIHKAQDDMRLYPDSDKDDSQFIKKNTFPLKEEPQRSDPVQSSNTRSPGKDDSDQSNLTNKDHDSHFGEKAQRPSMTLQIEEKLP